MVRFRGSSQFLLFVAHEESLWTSCRGYVSIETVDYMFIRIPRDIFGIHLWFCLLSVNCLT